MINTVWILLGLGTVILLVAAINKKDSDQCKAVEITIKGVQDNFFMDKSDVTRMLEKMNFGSLKGNAIAAFNLAGMEAILEKNEWIKKGNGAAELNTVAGGKLWVMKKNGSYWLKDENGGMAAITISNVYQSNGVIHVIDHVLLPK